MKRFGIIIALVVSLLAAAWPAKAEETLTASKVFENIPLQVLELLRPSTRLDMLDYYNQADSLWKAPNALEGYCQLQTVTPDYLSLRVSDVSNLQIKLLPFKSSQIVMTLYTVGDGSTAKDTEIRFFDADLNPLPSKGIWNAPDMTDFFNMKEVSKRDLDDAMPFQTIQYVTGPGSNTLTATFTTLQSLSKEERDKLKPFLRPAIQFDWNGKKYSPRK